MYTWRGKWMTPDPPFLNGPRCFALQMPICFQSLSTAFSESAVCLVRLFRWAKKIHQTAVKLQPSGEPHFWPPISFVVLPIHPSGGYQKLPMLTHALGM